MNEFDIRSLIKQELRSQINVLLYGEAGSTSQLTETINNMYAGMPGITNRPVMHPYGLVSRAPKGTTSVVGRVGDHIGARLVMGHRDTNRPELNEGETIIYNSFGQSIYLENGKIHLGTKSSNNPLVLGNDLKALLIELITAIKAHTHIDSIGGITQVPLNVGDFTSAQSGNVDNDKILSDKHFTEK